MSDLIEWYRLGIFHEVAVSKLELQSYENLTGLEPLPRWLTHMVCEVVLSSWFLSM